MDAQRGPEGAHLRLDERRAPRPRADQGRQRRAGRGVSGVMLGAFDVTEDDICLLAAVVL
ncbi:hypothetical protein [Nonomuraea sp. NPDC003709]|uniref:hypothetical protein n=1 Tax=Nonomuraea sp. NPDC003709 TaxID=3154450 RepID=UPI0033B8A1C2